LAASAGVLYVTSQVAQPQPPQITQQPKDQLVIEGGTATFGVTAVGTEPLQYSWTWPGKGLALGGSTFTTPPLSLSDNGKQVGCIVKNTVGSATCNSARVLVTGAKSLCGNSVIEGTEQCDDANFNEFDGCAATCVVLGSVPNAFVSPVWASNIGARSVTINWKTSLPGDSGVDYGTTASFGSWQWFQNPVGTQHAVILTDLTPQTLYFFRVRTNDIFGNVAFSPTLRLRTGADQQQSALPTFSAATPGATINIQDFPRLSGEPDDTKRIQRALDKLPSNGSLFFPAGKYWVTSTLTPKVPATVYGESQNNTTIFSPVPTVCGAGFYNLFQTKNSFTIRDITLQRNPVACKSSWKAISMEPTPTDPDIPLLRVENVKIQDFDIGIYASGGTKRAIVNGIVLHSTIMINRIGTGGGASVRPTVDISGTQNVLIQENTLDAVDRGQVNNVYIRGSRNIVIVGNRILRGIGVKIGTNQINGIDTVQIMNNTFEDTSLSTLFYLDSKPFGTISIDGNIFTGSRVLDPNTGDITLASYEQSTGTAYGQVSITNNSFKNIARGPILASLAAQDGINSLTVNSNGYLNWSSGTDASGRSLRGIYSVLSTGSRGAYGALIVDHETADGNDNGRQYLNACNFQNKQGVDMSTVTQVRVTGPVLAQCP
jgi:cysteine-rich repeat protein